MYTGVNLLARGAGTISQVAIRAFNADLDETGLTRYSNSFNESLHRNTQVQHLSWRRQVYIHLTSFSTFMTIAAQLTTMDHDPFPTQREQVQRQEWTIRFYCFYVSAFRVIDMLGYQLNRLHDVIEHLEGRIIALEVAAVQGIPLQMREQGPQPIWIPPPPSFWTSASVLDFDSQEPETEDMPTDEVRDL